MRMAKVQPTVGDRLVCLFRLWTPRSASVSLSFISVSSITRSQRSHFPSNLNDFILSPLKVTYDHFEDLDFVEDTAIGIAWSQSCV